MVTHLRDAEGATLAYLSPMNDPDYRFEGCGQEGMSVPPEQRAALVKAVGRELAARGSSCRVIADESSRTGEHFLREAASWLATPDTADYVAALAVHRYDYPNDLVLGLANTFSETFAKPLWSTELCCFATHTGAFGPRYDPTILNALMMANLMWQGMTVANDAAFHWGQGRNWTVVVISNARTDSRAIRLRLQLPPSEAVRLVPETAVETSAERDLEEVDLPSVSTTGLRTADVPSQSITTYVLRAAP